MKKKQLAADAVAKDTMVQSTGASPSKPPKVKKVRALGSDLYHKFWLASLILAAVSILLTFIAKNAINGTGYWHVELFKSFVKAPKKPLTLELEFLTSLRASVAAMVVGVAGVGCGITRNVLKRQKNMSGYIIPLIALILSVFAFCASYFVA